MTRNPSAFGDTSPSGSSPNGRCCGGHLGLAGTLQGPQRMSLLLFLSLARGPGSGGKKLSMTQLALEQI